MSTWFMNAPKTSKQCQFILKNVIYILYVFQVIGDKDADGFYWGECGKRSGYVPCNMVSEVQVEDERMLQDIFKEDRRGMGNMTRLSTILEILKI